MTGSSIVVQTCFETPKGGVSYLHRPVVDRLIQPIDGNQDVSTSTAALQSHPFDQHFASLYASSSCLHAAESSTTTMFTLAPALKWNDDLHVRALTVSDRSSMLYEEQARHATVHIEPIHTIPKDPMRPSPETKRLPWFDIDWLRGTDGEDEDCDDELVHWYQRRLPRLAPRSRAFVSNPVL